MPRNPKLGHRAKSGRLSRAYKGAARDAGTPELQAKKLRAVNGAADPSLSASPAAILFAHGVLNREQLTAADRYHQLYRRSFGLPDHGRCLLNEQPPGTALSDELLERARQRLDAMVAKLSADQKHAIDNLVVSAWIPGWFYAAKGIGRPLESDERDRQALVTGLEVLVGP